MITIFSPIHCWIEINMAATNNNIVTASNTLISTLNNFMMINLTDWWIKKITNVHFKEVHQYGTTGSNQIWLMYNILHYLSTDHSRGNTIGMTHYKHPYLVQSKRYCRSVSQYPNNKSETHWYQGWDKLSSNSVELSIIKTKIHS